MNYFVEFGDGGLTFESDSMGNPVPVYKNDSKTELVSPITCVVLGEDNVYRNVNRFPVKVSGTNTFHVCIRYPDIRNFNFTTGERIISELRVVDENGNVIILTDVLYSVDRMEGLKIDLYSPKPLKTKQVYVTESTVQEYGTIRPTFTWEDNKGYSSGELKYLHHLVGKRVRLTLEVLD